ncbi:DNA-directed RNA polymerase subunit beta [Myxococcota bacterium]|nr:DNA-directed RNA polymerase subunit beta [Myxococcota bacterium]MBU1382637.1 DNA-directed RNA polymerase subunit beta [Myxococcota bacterium]MBU1495854.1 DNA-directed RNA polymerase subunit beta [Myxococcota bacterium]
MSSLIQRNSRFRRTFSKIHCPVSIPNLISFQKESYEYFLQMDVHPDDRKDTGLQKVFKDIFPITDYQGISSLEFVKYTIEPPKYDVEECRQRGLTYEATVRVTIRLIIWDKPATEDEENPEVSEAREIRDFKEEEVFFGTIPLITDYGTFMINGVERVVVSQLHRSPGVFFDHDKGKGHVSKKLLYSARLIPARGSWLDFEFDAKDILYVRIDRRKKMPASILLRALGMDTPTILNTYYFTETIRPLDDSTWKKEIDLDKLLNFSLNYDIIASETREILIPRKKKLSKKRIRDAKKLGGDIHIVPDAYLLGKEGFTPKIIAEDIIDPSTGEVLATCNQIVTREVLKKLREAAISEFKTFFIDNRHVHDYMRQTTTVDKVNSPEEAILEIYKRLRPGEPPTLETAKKYFESLFFDPNRYDLSRVGRMKINLKFKYKPVKTETILCSEDIIETIRYLLRLRENHGTIDDIDHLGNRRIRAVGELLEAQYRAGLERLKRAVRERMATSGEMETCMPHDLVNSRPVASAVKEYFSSSQLSQFMDQTNPLSEITHKRRLSALGPGGLTRERAGFDVRDVHSTHYGRICPIETPEGPNIGLIASLASHAKINEFGFIETPYRDVIERKVVDTDGHIRYYSALEEEDHKIVEATIPYDEEGYIKPNWSSVRHSGEVINITTEEITLMDVAPEQLVSVAASLIPFLEHDDANRALMGANMQRQAVPLVKTRAPLVATKLEPHIARDSGVCVVAKRDGSVVMVDGARIVVKPDIDENSIDLGKDVKPDIYTLVKFRRTNQNTCYNQKPIVDVGDRVKAGDVIADGPATEMGELALGQNVVVAFMPWSGYNFEDSILINERLVKEDAFTSIHIEEYECDAKETKLGSEEITRDIPNVSDEALKDLDDAGIVRIGAEVKPGDILVGKVTPKGETQLTPEEKLLKAIFGEKAGDVKDTSLRVPPGVQGIVIGAQIFSRRGQEKDKRSREIEDELKEKLHTDQADEIKIVSQSYYAGMKKLILGKVTASRLIDDTGKVLLPKGVEIDEISLNKVPRRYWPEIQIRDSNGSVENKLESLSRSLEDTIHDIETFYREKITRLTKSDELGTGVLKKVKVYLAIKRKLSVGDKMAGRHGNKGVVSRILPEEDMPYMPDGTPVDIVLNPLGVPSRMNVGQILETHLGLAALELGHQINEYIETVDWKTEVIRHQLKKLYPTPQAEKVIELLDSDDIKRWANKIRNGIHFFTPVFEGISEEEIKSLLQMAGQDESGQMVLFDGRTGDAFHRPVTVGVMYVLKLHHLVDDKIHARSTGPYALVTQQPLGGKAQFGGQRLGEMEVWAVEAYGAAYSLQEFLTVKSDDVAGRTRMFEAIVKGDNTLKPGLPESFNVLLKEMQSLCLNLETITEDSPVRHDIPIVTTLRDGMFF